MTMGENNPNHRHAKSLECFDPLTHDGAYILGFIWADGSLSESGVEITQKDSDAGILVDISRKLFAGEDLTVLKKGAVGNAEPQHSLTINSKEFVSYLLSLGGICVGKKSNKIEFPKIPFEYIDSFLCGFFDGDGSIRQGRGSPEISFSSTSVKFLEQICDHFNLSSEPIHGSLSIHGFRALDVLGELYKNVSIKHERKYKLFMEKLNWNPSGTWRTHGEFYYRKLTKDAMAPEKKRVTDSGYDVWAVEFEDKGNGVYIADTKLAVRPPDGWYFDLVGRSSLPKNGLHFLGGVGIIDRTYTGPIKMYVQKIGDAELPQLPFKIGQLILRPIVHVKLTQVDKLDESSRGSAGFGSTDGSTGVNDGKV